jgi:hypothetical protein
MVLFNAWRRRGRTALLVDDSVLDPLLRPGPGSPWALAWLQQVGDARLAMSAWSASVLEGHLATHPNQPLLDAFIKERCPVISYLPLDFEGVRRMQRSRPGVAPLQVLLELQLAERLELLAVSVSAPMLEAARRLHDPLEVPSLVPLQVTLQVPASRGLTSSSWGPASTNPSWR